MQQDITEEILVIGTFAPIAIGFLLVAIISATTAVAVAAAMWAIPPLLAVHSLWRKGGGHEIHRPSLGWSQPANSRLK